MSIDVEATFPLSLALGLNLLPIAYGFDSHEVKDKLGDDRYQQLLGDVESVFVCGHRTSPVEVTKDGKTSVVECEVPCIYAEDLEKFLREEGQ